MTTITPDFLRDRAVDFREMSNRLFDYRMNNWETLTQQQHALLEKKEIQLMQISGDFNGLSIIFAVDNAEAEIEKIKTATTNLKKAIEEIDDIETFFSKATKAITLGAAIASGNLVTIAAAVSGASG